MNLEERMLEALGEQENGDEEETITADWLKKRRQRLQRQSLAYCEKFLSARRRSHTACTLPRYYGELLTWALQQHLERDGWKIVRTLPYQSPEPIYTDVDTGSEIVSLLREGQLLVEKSSTHLIITVDVHRRYKAWVQLEGPADKQKDLEQFISAVMTIAKVENFYRGRNIEFFGLLRFLNAVGRSWDSIVLEAETKMEIRANSVDFLKRSMDWNRYGIPLKRGILLAGEPGTGKTAICKALMAEARGITCITTNGYALDSEDYVTELYDLAQDLSPSIVFLEDIDLIGQNRLEFGYQRGPALLSLLSVLDGIEEKSEIITLATTNCLETLDKALSERPSRFDRVIKLARPSMEQRRELVCRLCRKIPLDKGVQEYICNKTESCTPAQLQEIVYSLVIQRQAGQTGMALSRSDIDMAISEINGKGKHKIGFEGVNRFDSVSQTRELKITEGGWENDGTQENK